jgi:integrase
MTAPRRAYGEGALTQLPDGTWKARIWVDRLDGQHVRRSLYGKTKSLVVEKVKQTHIQAAQGSGPGGRSQTLGAFLLSWLWDSARVRLKPSTYIRYSELVGLHITPGLGGVRLEKLSVQQVQHFLNAKVDRGMAPQTACHLRAVLRTALNHAIKIRLITFNAAALSEKPRVPERERTVLVPEQVPGFLEATAADEQGAIFVLALATGLRQGELLGLRWQDIDLQRGRLQVTRNARRMRRVPGQPTRLEYGTPKSKNSRRTVPLAPVAVTALQHHRERELFKRRAAGENWLETGSVFTCPDGQPLEAKHVGRAWAKLLRRAELPRMRFHDLRHSCATFLDANGIQPRLIMAVLGHADIRTTMGYVHANSEMMNEAADAMQRVMERGVGS